MVPNMSTLHKNLEEEITRWTKEIRRGAITLAILALLSQKRAYGCELVKWLGEKVSFLELEQGTVYPLLRRLFARHFLDAEWDYSDPTKPKNTTNLLMMGKRHFGGCVKFALSYPMG